MPRIRNPIRLIQAAIGSLSPHQVAIEPRLPPELEEIIFLLAAWQSSFEEIMELLLVARRVHDWLCPFAFKVVLAFPHQAFPIQFTQHSFVRYGKHIQHLAIDVRLPVYRSKRNPLCQVLKDCPNLVNLYLDHYELTDTTNLVPALSLLPLTQLAIYLPLLIAQLGDTALTTPVFPNITHLQALGAPFDSESTHDEEKQAHVLSTHFPNLTHLALKAVDSYRFETGIDLTLNRCRHIQMVVWWHPCGEVRFTTLPVHHSRIFNVYCDEVYVWKWGAIGKGKDIWELGREAEEREEEVKKLIVIRELRWMERYWVDDSE